MSRRTSCWMLMVVLSVGMTVSPPARARARELIVRPSNPQDDDGVTATVADRATGAEETVLAR